MYKSMIRFVFIEESAYVIDRVSDFGMVGRGMDGFACNAVFDNDPIVRTKTSFVVMIVQRIERY